MEMHNVLYLKRGIHLFVTTRGQTSGAQPLITLRGLVVS